MLTVKTPLRISFFGGGSDFPDHYLKHGGACLSIAIDLHTYVSIIQKYDNKLTINGRINETVDAGQLPKHGLIRATIQHLYYQYGITAENMEIITAANVSGIGTGLGGSSSFLVGLIYALSYGNSIPVTRKLHSLQEWLTETANYIEIDILERPQGIQDAYPAAYGGLRLYEFGQAGDHYVSPVMMTAVTNELNSKILLFDMGPRLSPSYEVLTEQHEKTAVNSKRLSELANMARYGWDMLKRGRIDDFGALLDEGWKTKRTLSDSITTPAINSFYEAAKKAGALGGKLCGAGAGGYMVIYSPNHETRQRIKKTARKMGIDETPINIYQRGSECYSNY